MHWYKRSVVFAIGLFLELIIATITTILIKGNGAWLRTLALPPFAPETFFPYGVLMEVTYLSSAFSLSLYASQASDLPKGILLTVVEGSSEIVTLLFFFRFTYEITSFFLATITMILSAIVTIIFLGKKDSAGIARIPTLLVTLYFWTILYCILMINFA